MFREMRRKGQQLSEEAAYDILSSGSHGVLALSGDEGWPYAVPLSYALDGSSVYFHCAREGHKIDAVRKDGRGCLCVVARDDVAPEELTTRYVSAVAFGEIEELRDEEEKLSALRLLCAKYCPDAGQGAVEAEIERDRPGVSILKMRILHLTAKAERKTARQMK